MNGRTYVPPLRRKRRRSVVGALDAYVNREAKRERDAVTYRAVRVESQLTSNRKAHGSMRLAEDCPHWGVGMLSRKAGEYDRGGYSMCASILRRELEHRKSRLLKQKPTRYPIPG